MYSYTDEVFMIFKLDGENPPGVLSEVETSSCAPLNQCDLKFCSDGISMIIATTLCMYQVAYNKLQLSHPILDDNLLLELCCNLWAWFYVCLYLLLSSLV
jgi:hypothetical protein